MAKIALHNILDSLGLNQLVVDNPKDLEKIKAQLRKMSDELKQEGR